MSATFSMEKLLEKGQGTGARILDKLPRIVQQQLSVALGFKHNFPDLHPFLKCLNAIQTKQGKTTLIGQDPEKSRQVFEQQMQSIATTPTNVEQVEDIRLNLQNGLIFARHYHPAPKKKLPLIVFYHGGGFVVGSLDTHDEACRLLAKHAQAQVLSIAYPLAPEYSPQQLIQCCEDALAWVYQHRKQLNIYKERIAVCGDSAGGNISAVLAQRTANRAYAPSAQFLIYPAVDFKSRYSSYHLYKEGLVLTDQDIDNVTQFYANQHNIALDDPIISPMFGDVDKVAPAFVVTAGHDVLHDEGEIYSRKLKQAGVKVEYHEIKDQTHGFINLTPVHGAAKKHYIQMIKQFKTFWKKNHRHKI